jgi:hypothetical protein
MHFGRRQLANYKQGRASYTASYILYSEYHASTGTVLTTPSMAGCTFSQHHVAVVAAVQNGHPITRASPRERRDDINLMKISTIFRSFTIQLGL